MSARTQPRPVVVPPPPAPVEAGEFKMVPVARVSESELNPRRHYDPHKLEDLAASIRTHGIITPLLARPSWTPVDQEQCYEIAAGHRRYRAAKLAGLPELPLIIRDMSDGVFLEILTIENLQREDIHALEEADGFAALLKQPGYTVAILADKLGKPEAYVHGRIALLQLVEPVRGAFLENRITIGHARLIARLDPSQQEKACQECFASWGRRQGELVAIGELKEWIRSSSGRDLSKAPFDIEAVIEPPKGLFIAACITCAKAVGVNPLLIDEDGQKTCLEPACFDRKVQAHLALKTKAGLVAISTKYDPQQVGKSGAIAAREYEEIYTEPDENDIEEVEQLERELLNPDLEPEERKETEQQLADLREQMAEQEQDCGFSELGVVVDGHGVNDLGKEKRICRNAKCPVHGKMLALSSGGSKRDDKREKAAEEKRKLEARIKWHTRLAVLRKVLAAPLKWSIPKDQLRVIALARLPYSTPPDAIDALRLSHLVGKKWKNGSDVTAELKKIIGSPDGSPSADYLPRIVFMLSICESVKEYVQESDIERLKAAAKSTGVDWRGVEAEVTKSLKEDAARKKAKSEAKTATKKPTKKAGSDRKRAAAGGEDDDQSEEWEAPTEPTEKIEFFGPKAKKGSPLADVLIWADEHGWFVTVGISLPTKAGEGYGESGPLLISGETGSAKRGDPEAFWDDLAAAKTAAYSWMLKWLPRVDTYGGATLATTGAARQVRDWAKEQLFDLGVDDE